MRNRLFAVILALLPLPASCTSTPPKPAPAPAMSAGEAYERAIALRDANDYEGARGLLLYAAGKHHAEAQFELGYWYLSGRGGVVDLPQAAQWIERAADQDQPDALRYVWQLYFFGRGVPKDIAKALIWLRRGAESGDAQLALRLGVWLFDSAGDRQNALKYLKLAADHEPRACRYLAQAALDDGNTRDAVYWLDKGANGGDAACQLGLGDCYRDGKGVARSREKARACYKAAAAALGEPEITKAARERLRELDAE
ncbi:MAG: sel1 repeat family protein [Planctomycetes bacterium]|nr:sel1 repeat family protein [Planctomycetota bacterium]